MRTIVSKWVVAEECHVWEVFEQLSNLGGHRDQCNWLLIWGEVEVKPTEDPSYLICYTVGV